MSAPASHVAVVDDDASVRQGLARLLRAAGYTVEVFASARAFIERGEYDRVACLVLDVRMPEQGGLHLQQHLLTSGHDVPIVFITGHGDVGMAVHALRAGAVDFLAKPFDDHEFLGAVERAAARHRDGSGSP